MLTIDQLKTQIAELNAERESHVQQRSNHDKRARELAKQIVTHERELIKMYATQPPTTKTDEPEAEPSEQHSETPTNSKEAKKATQKSPLK